MNYLLDLQSKKEILLVGYSINLLKKNFILGVYDIFDENVLKRTDFINKFFCIITEFYEDSLIYVMSI